jgi:hypothetical protein
MPDRKLVDYDCRYNCVAKEAGIEVQIPFMSRANQSVVRRAQSQSSMGCQIPEEGP